MFSYRTILHIRATALRLLSNAALKRRTANGSASKILHRILYVFLYIRLSHRLLPLSLPHYNTLRVLKYGKPKRAEHQIPAVSHARTWKTRLVFFFYYYQTRQAVRRQPLTTNHSAACLISPQPTSFLRHLGQGRGYYI